MHLIRYIWNIMQFMRQFISLIWQLRRMHPPTFLQKCIYMTFPRKKKKKNRQVEIVKYHFRMPNFFFINILSGPILRHLQQISNLIDFFLKVTLKIYTSSQMAKLSNLLKTTFCKEEPENVNFAWKLNKENQRDRMLQLYIPHRCHIYIWDRTWNKYHTRYILQTLIFHLVFISHRK